ncbi:hypothetical protein ZIOFF_034099 [Zingiber officinale]|uniref:Clp ATPase C-terminal domain-containing protein n=1 Tax=Zingiber officinale TaxID=94328 RepID=A0A8J5H383_ZINOF|nr:hypothetical protein ZIOFF_034099 [Zingiber officinale]
MSEQHLPEKAIDLDDQSHADIRKVNFDYSVILFDRVEKAHNFVLKRLLVMIGLGRLTDGQNINVDITNTVIIMTFNLTGTAKDSSLQIAREILIDEVTKHFEPEDLNRFDEIVIFDPLSHDQLRKVARFQMIDIALRLAQRGVALSVTNAAWDVVVSQSYHRFYGGNPIHPIKRRLAKKIVTRLSQMLIQGKIDDDSIVYVDAVPGVKELSYENPHGLNIVAAAHDPYKRVVRGLASIPCYNLRTSLAGVNCNLIDRSRKARRMVYKVEGESKFRRQKSIKKGEAQQQETIMRLKKDCKFKKRGFSEEQVAISSAMLLIACIACSPPS